MPIADGDKARGLRIFCGSGDNSCGQGVWRDHSVARTGRIFPAPTPAWTLQRQFLRQFYTMSGFDRLPLTGTGMVQLTRFAGGEMRTLTECAAFDEKAGVVAAIDLLQYSWRHACRDSCRDFWECGLGGYAARARSMRVLESGLSDALRAGRGCLL